YSVVKGWNVFQSHQIGKTCPAWSHSFGALRWYAIASPDVGGAEAMKTSMARRAAMTAMGRRIQPAELHARRAARSSLGMNGSAAAAPASATAISTGRRNACAYPSTKRSVAGKA